MALIKCPECGKEVSEELGKCPYCDEVLKRDEAISVSIKQNTMIEYVKKQKNLFIVVGVTIILIIGIVIFIKYNSKDVYDYTGFIGKFYKDLPFDFETEQFNDVFYDAKLDKTVKFSGYKGEISFTYSVDEMMEELGIKTNALDKLLWKADENSNKQLDKLKNALEKKYGEYDEFDTYANSELNKYGEGEGETIIYAWNNKEGMNIELNYETDESDEIVDIAIIWSEEK